MKKHIILLGAVLVSSSAFSANYPYYPQQETYQQGYYRQGEPSQSSYYYQERTPSNMEIRIESAPNAGQRSAYFRDTQNPNATQFNQNDSSFTDQRRPQTYDNQFSTQGTDTRSRLPDTEIATKVQDALKGGMFTKGYKNINVRVVNGVVSLSGTVDKEEDREDIRSKIRGIAGIRSIDDRLIVSGRQSQSQMDFNRSSSPSRY